MADIAITRTTPFGGVLQNDWLRSAHGTDCTEGKTADISLFTAGTHYPDGYLLPGIGVGIVTATGFVGPYNNAAVNGQETLYGFIYGVHQVVSTATEGFSQTARTRVGIAVLVHGGIVGAKLPIAQGTAGSVGTDAGGLAGRVDVAGRIWFV